MPWRQMKSKASRGLSSWRAALYSNISCTACTLRETTPRSVRGPSGCQLGPELRLVTTRDAWSLSTSSSKDGQCRFMAAWDCKGRDDRAGPGPGYLPRRQSWSRSDAPASLRAGGEANIPTLARAVGNLCLVSRRHQERRRQQRGQVGRNAWRQGALGLQTGRSTIVSAFILNHTRAPQRQQKERYNITHAMKTLEFMKIRFDRSKAVANPCKYNLTCTKPSKINEKHMKNNFSSLS
jgi:hypothetical protein